MEEKQMSHEEIYLARDEVRNDEMHSYKETNASGSDAMEAGVVLEPKPEKVHTVSEILELRNETRKVFRMSDGTQRAVFYPETVHVFDEETQMYEEVNNTLLEEEDRRHFKNVKNRFAARFSNEETNDELFSVEKGMHAITVSVKKPQKQINRGVLPHLRKRELTEVWSRDTLTFDNVLSDADLEYSVGGDGVKENIIVKEKADVYRYPFVLDCQNVTVEHMEEEKQVKFCDPESGKEVFCIPAPFMTDANGEVSTDVFYEVKPQSDGRISFTVTADSTWMNAEERAFPVTIDPQVKVTGSVQMSTYSWNNGSLYMSSSHTVGTTGNANCNANRMYMKFTMPTLPRNPRIKKAELMFKQSSGTCASGEYPRMGLYQVTGPIVTGTCTPVNASDLLDYQRIKDGSGAEYTFDVTSLVDRLNKGETTSAALVLKMLDESNLSSDKVVLCGSTHMSNPPILCITYESSYGVNTSYRTHTHELGRFGQGSVDLQCGNLMLESEDFAWAGNRMPVTIKHLYTSALAGYQYTANSSIQLNVADFSAMRLGNGWKLNLMQSMVSTNFQHDGKLYEGYVYVDENGSETFFKRSDKQMCNAEDNVCYYLYEDVKSREVYYDPYTLEILKGTRTYLFDDAGRLIRITDEHGNQMVMTYTSGRLTSVTDGAGRDFSFTYNASGYLLAITAPDGTTVSYGYSDSGLARITYPNGKRVFITSEAGKPTAVVLKDATDTDLYKVAYTYSGDRVSKIVEYGVEDGAFVTGVSYEYSYSAASGRTIVQTAEPRDTDETADSVMKTVYAFDDDGNIVSEYIYTEDTGNVSVDGGGSGIHPHAEGTGVVSNINNLLLNHSFTGMSNWTATSANCDDFCTSNNFNEKVAKFGRYATLLRSNNVNCVANGLYQDTVTLSAGEYTFSAYLRVTKPFTGGTNPGAYIRVTTTSGTVLAESERIRTADIEYVRLIAPFELSTSMSVRVCVFVDGRGSAYVDGAQLENAPFANEYNMLVNGNFERGAVGWTPSAEGTAISTNEHFNMTRSMSIVGDLDSERYVQQVVDVKASESTCEIFTLSGWAKGYGIVSCEREGCFDPQFRLRAEILYSDGTTTTEPIATDFSPCTEGWQFASVKFGKDAYKKINCIKIYCEYNYNSGLVYFDNIQLVRYLWKQDVIMDDFRTVNDSEDDTNAETEVEDYIVDATPTFEEKKDIYGNTLTETTFTNGEFGTIYRALGFNPACNCMTNAGNDLIRETDSRGNWIEYTVDCDTSRNEEVTDRCGNKTAYEYDVSGRIIKKTNKEADGAEVAYVSYDYDAFDNLTKIIRGDGLEYELTYNGYRNLESVGMRGREKTFASYAYKNGNSRLKQVVFAHGHVVKVVYNDRGQLEAERWYDADDNLTGYNKYVYDGRGNIVRSIDFTNQKEYIYTYDDGKITRVTENDISVSADEIIIGKTWVSSIYYYYDKKNKVTKKRFLAADGTEGVVCFENSEERNMVVKFTAGGKTVISHSKSDSFGRKVFDELQLGTGFVSRQFSYHMGAETEEHKANDMLKSSPTTQLVSQIVLSDGRTLSYEYDAEERITKVTESADGEIQSTTEYTYDALGQLLTETVNGVLVNNMTYDNYGNIVEKNGITYAYGDVAWKDLLTGYGGKTISYDALGNPTSYLGHDLTWGNGRQLKSYDSNVYIYNANGIRTSKTVDGIQHSYVLDDAKILRETWGSNTLIPMYDNEEAVCGIIYNEEPYYFLKNLQGDIVAIVDKFATIVARYNYDAWGVCTIVKDESICKIASINPYRYRGYYLDVETNLYYLQSRYYDSQVGRFINVDYLGYLNNVWQCLDYNLFAYCLNNPINHQDYMGYGEVLNAVKQCPENHAKAIQNSLLPQTREAVFANRLDRFKSLKYIGDGFVEVVFGYDVGPTLRHISTYLVGVKTEEEWRAFLDEKNWFRKFLQSQASQASDFFGVEVYGAPDWFGPLSVGLWGLSEILSKSTIFDRYISKMLYGEKAVTSKFKIPHCGNITEIIYYYIALSINTIKQTPHRDYVFWGTKRWSTSSSKTFHAEDIQ